MHLSEAELAELAELRDLAVSNAGGVPLGDPRRRASERFSALIASAHDRGVTWRELSAATGLTTAALKARVARHGLSGRPATYKNVQSRMGGGGSQQATDTTGRGALGVPVTGLRYCRNHA